MGEHWVPICFPLFDAYKFMHCYICAIHERLILVLISHNIRDFISFQYICKQFKDLL